mmetsp:Transcript_3705/g.6549  ORF Transcript_3705/g.6549 Transcript_3705/m.6549 type:complete len:233 (+) Transcript_3705:262-960(+)
MGLRPQIRGQETIGLAQSGEDSLDEVSKGTGLTSGLGEAIFDTSKVQKLLGHRGSDQTGTTGGRDQAHAARAALASHLARHGVRSTDLVTPVATADRDNSDLGALDGSSDGGGNLLGAIDTQTDVAIAVTNNDEGFETGALTGLGLLLHRGNLHHFILKLGLSGQELVNDLELLDGQGEKVDLLQLAKLSFLDQTTKLGAGDPLLLFGLTLSLALALALPLASTLSEALAFL